MGELASFATGIRAAESGSPQGNYHQVKGRVRGGRVLGAYGFPSDEWARIADEVGLSGARWGDARAQDLVAERIFQRLYEKYNDWRLVAVAWKAGEKIADQVAAHPNLLRRKELAPVKDYVTQVMGHAADFVSSAKPVMPDGTPVDPIRFQPNMAGLAVTQTASQNSAEDALRGILRGMKTRRMALDSQLSTQGDEPEQPGVPEEPEKTGLIERALRWPNG